MDLRFQHRCSQCGADFFLGEAERLLHCRYCGVKSYLTAAVPFHFVLPHQAPADQEMIFVPYWRFKGNVFTCQASRVDFRFVDITQNAAPGIGVPESLGFRAQAMTLKLLDPQTEGVFLNPVLDLADILAKVAKLDPQPARETVYHRACIGERTSLVYLPLYRQRNQLVDGITHRPLRSLEEEENIGPQLSAPPSSWKLKTLPTLCPVCGWHLEGEKDSVALICRNCERAFGTASGEFVPLRHAVVAGGGGEAIHLPFWKLTVTCSNPPIASFADFIRVTRQPRIPPAEWEQRPMSVWCPAFRIRPKVFLQLLRAATMAQPPAAGDAPFGLHPLFPVTLPGSEAAQTLKLVLAGLTMKKSDLFPLLPATRFEVLDTSLVYLPFRDNGRELVQSCVPISIDKNALDFGRKL